MAQRGQRAQLPAERLALAQFEGWAQTTDVR